MPTKTANAPGKVTVPSASTVSQAQNTPDRTEATVVLTPSILVPVAKYSAQAMNPTQVIRLSVLLIWVQIPASIPIEIPIPM